MKPTHLLLPATIIVGIICLFCPPSGLAIIAKTLTVIGITCLVVDFIRCRWINRQAPPEPTEITYAEFLHAMRAVADAFPNAKLFFGKLYQATTSYKWEERRKWHRPASQANSFINSMHKYFWDLISATHDHTAVQEEARQYFCAVRAKCVELGINIDGINFNPPLLPREASETQADMNLTLTHIAINNDPPGDVF